jgi:hypothetical protein
MRTIRYLSSAFFTCAAVVLLGCNDSPRSEPPGSSLSAPPASKEAGTGPVESPTVTFTEKAVAKVEEIIREGQNAGTLPNEMLYLRVRVVPGGCHGYLHKLDLDPDISADDQVCVGRYPRRHIQAPGRDVEGHPG